MEYSSPYDEPEEKAPTPTFGLECNACGSLNLFLNPSAFQCRECGEIEKIAPKAWALMSNINLVKTTIWELIGQDKELLEQLKNRFSIYPDIDYTPHEMYCKLVNIYTYITNPIPPSPTPKQHSPKKELVPCLKITLIKVKESELWETISPSFTR